MTVVMWFIIGITQKVAEISIKFSSMYGRTKIHGHAYNMIKLAGYTKHKCVIVVDFKTLKSNTNFMYHMLAM